MKKFISLLLALIILAVPVCAMVATADDTPLTHVCIVQLPAETKQYTVEPVEPYSYAEGNIVYVRQGDSFTFKVIPKEGYSVQMLQVSYYDTENEKATTVPLERMKAYDTYTIDAVTVDTTVSCDYVMSSDRAWLFRSLVEFVRQIIDFFARIFGTDTDA